MNIVIEGFKIKDSEGITLFDLYEVKTVQSGKSEGESIDVAFAYGISFPRCIQIIIQEKMKVENGSINLDGYIKAYETTSNRILDEARKIFVKK